ncbi:MAG: 3-deoxy-manno-octulosonate cytidylyltransferase [Bacteroidales bacterium]
MNAIGIIPARYASTRFPGKPLVMIQGKSMIQRVYEQACKCTALMEVVVATDHQEIYDHVGLFGKVVMTKHTHSSGTDRCLEALSLVNNGRYGPRDIVVNIQGDEPFVNPLQIEMLIGLFAEKHCQIGSLIKKIEKREELFDTNVVKVVVGSDKKAIYFSRATVPHYRDLPADLWAQKGAFYKHLGMYGYRVETLEKIGQLSQGVLEKAESLEQLRWIENGFDIYVNETGLEHLAIDTPEDLKKIVE